jgi:PAT family beta-lactamase induction signal transducer AmpG|tara:strand:- start:1036 stop:2325 length:1290 start_codon:yes stop_codon:yes gene_type:complete
MLFGFCSGFPFVLTGSVLTLWLQESGFSRSTIGFIGAISTVYAINWMWAPFVDRIKLPILYRLFGQRRSWILFCQMAIALLLLAISFGDPRENLLYVTLIAVAIATFSATLDIAVDAYRITIFSRDEMDAKMPYAAAMTTSGWWAGYGFVGGALALALGGETIGLDWPVVYRYLILIYVFIFALVIASPEPVIEEADLIPEAKNAERSVSAWILKYFVGPFKEFFNRCGFRLALSVLLFLLVFKLGESMLGRMSLLFYVEVGFTTDQISFYSKFFGGLVTAAFAILAAMVNTRFGVMRGLFIAGVAMAAANLLYALIAIVGPNTNLFIFTLIIDNFFVAFSTVAFVSFISYFTSRTYTGTQYALMVSISNLGRTTLAAGSGALVDFLNGDWAFFFVLTSLMVIPGLCLLVWVRSLMKAYEPEQAAQPTS